MIVLVKRNNIFLIGLIFLLLIAIYSLNFSAGEAAAVVKNEQSPPGPTITVVIDAGHGGEDPGAVSDYSGLREKDVNLSVATKVKDLLEKENFNVIMTRSEDRLEYEPGTSGIIQKRKQDLLRRKGIMDDPNVNAVVSIHLNKFPETQYFGAQTFFPHNSPESQKLAIEIQKMLREMVDPENKREALVRGKPDELPIIILRDLKNTTVIVECGFLSNEAEEKKLATDEYRQKLAEAIAKGVVNYFSNK